MTELKKPVRRRAVILLDSRREARPHDHVVVTLHPHGLIGFRPVRGRTEYALPLAVAYRLAMDADAREKATKKRKAKT